MNFWGKYYVALSANVSPGQVLVNVKSTVKSFENGFADPESKDDVIVVLGEHEHHLSSGHTIHRGSLLATVFYPES
jgi:proteasome assembly chaperone (PAC2) family protein